MKKVVRDNRDQIIGRADTTLSRKTFTEFIDKANYTHRGWVSETVKSLSSKEREEVEQIGQLY